MALASAPPGAFTRSTPLRDAASEVFDELVEGDAAAVDALAGPHADRPGGDVVVTQDRHVGHLLLGGHPDAMPERLVGTLDLHPAAGAAEAPGHGDGVVVVAVGHREHGHLDRRQPEREGA